MDLIFHQYDLQIRNKLNIPYEYIEYKVNSINLAELIRFTEARATVVATLKQSLQSRDDNKPSLIETVYIENQGDTLHDKTSLYQKARNRFTRISQSGKYQSLIYEEGETSYFDSGWDQMVDTSAILIYGVPKSDSDALTEQENELVEEIQRIDRDLDQIFSNIIKIDA